MASTGTTYALIGKTLKHSYSKEIHAQLGGYDYELVELEENSLKNFVSENKFSGYNVTIPYKKKIIEYLDELDESAKTAGSVNTVAIKNGKKIGYNTDFKGMLYTISRSGIVLSDKKVMILGTGGTASTAFAVCRHLNAREIIFVSRNGEINYSNYQDYKDVDVIINTTPVGMYPNVSCVPIDLTAFTNLSGVIDVIYNPLKTKLTLTAEKMGVKCVNGLSMLVMQGAFANEIWTGKKLNIKQIDLLFKKVEDKFKNIVLIGMPGAGKSTVGKAIAQILDKEFIDTDKLIQERQNKTPSEIILSLGEDRFREIEAEIIKEVCLKGGRVIATGGGAVLKEENRFYLKMNGVIFYLERNLKNLSVLDRPLSMGGNLERLYLERKPIYESLSDYTINNDGEINFAIKGVLENL